MQSKPLFMYPPVWMATGLGAQWALDHYYPLLQLIAAPWPHWSDFLGIAIIVASVLKVIWINFQFKRAKTTIIPYKEPEALLDTGFFAHSRNPIYLAMLFVLLGSALIYGSLSVLLPAIIFPFIIYYRFIRVEEAMMEEHLGEAYTAYKTRVRRWL